MNARVGPLADGFDATLQDAHKLVKNLDGRVKPLAGARGVLFQDAPLIVELEIALKEISDAARSIRQLANTLDQKPEALIQGLGKSGEK